MYKRINNEFLRYLAASAIALAIDMGILLSLAHAIHYMLATVIAFLCGSFAHYLLAVKLVFTTRRFADRTHAESTIFVTAGILGLGINTGIIFLSVELLHAPLSLAKLLAAGISFFAGFAARKILLFS